ncbi:MAG: VCBS repeat-containing protein [Actinomycetota bacterium]
MRLSCVLAAIFTLLTAGCGSDEPGAATSSTAAEAATPPAASPTASPGVPALTGTPVIVGPESVAGWWNGSDWVVSESGVAQVPVEGGETYKLVRLDDPIVSAAGSAAMEGCETNPGTSKIEIPGLDREFDNAEPPAIAVSAVNNPRPRAVEVLNPQAKLYKDAAARLLKERGIDDADADVVQVIRADLDDDGKSEVIVVAERIADSQSLFARVGDYSLVVLRRVVDERLTTTVVEEYVPVARPDYTPFITSQRVAAVADLNGDGRMELAVAGRYYEGAGVNFYELKRDGSIPEVMRSGCGA